MSRPARAGKGAPSRPGWVKTDGHGKFGTWRHTSGATVTHGGHPTAVYPFYGALANGVRPLMELDGKLCVPKFKYLSECQEWIEEQQAQQAL